MNPWVLLWTTLCSSLVPLVRARIYDYGGGKGDTLLSFPDWSVGTLKVDLHEAISPLMGSDNGVRSLWINSYGSVSYSELAGAGNIREVSDNVIIAPFMIESIAGEVWYRQVTTDTDTLSMIAEDLNNGGEVENPDNIPTFALIVTWAKLKSPDSDEENSAQLVLVKTSAGKTLVLFNYEEPISWTSSSYRGEHHAAAGIFTTGEATARCERHLESSATEQVWSLSYTSTGTGRAGMHVLDITQPLTCSSFVSPCEDITEQKRGTMRSHFRFSDLGLFEWEFYLTYTCQNGLAIRPGVSTQDIKCRYDGDYYEFNWDVPQKCSDPTAVDTFVTKICFCSSEVVDPIGVEKTVDVAVPDSSSYVTVDGQCAIITTTVPLERWSKPGSFKDAVEKALPKADECPTTVEVEDETPACLKSCICRYNKDKKDREACRTGNGFVPALLPSGCCGGCDSGSSVPGKPYSSSIKACCGGRTLYDPEKAVCCAGGRIRRGTKCPS